ncbi:MAG: helicase-associated domain-containing protein [Candidatus Hinthialibacter antarcticus]|nr:helicase-associated domain-containing protein [Candidatus Hinthialibacter antarcticus]
MNLYQMLTHIPHERLQRIAEAFGSGAYSPSKRNLLQSISGRYRDAEFIADLVNDLPYECRGLLRGLTFFTPPQQEDFTLSAELAAGWRHETPLRDLVEEIAGNGLLFHNDFHLNGRVVLPFELREILRSAFISQFKPLEPKQTSAESMLASRHVSVEAVYHLLCVLLHVRAKQTQKGSFHKRIYERWVERIGEDQATQHRFDFAEAFALHHHLIRANDSAFKLSDNAAVWFAKSETSRRRDVWRFLLNQHIEPSRAFQRLLVLLAAAESETETGARFSVRDLLSELELNAWSEESKVVTPESLTARLRLLEAAGVIILDDAKDPQITGLTSWGRKMLSLQTQEEPESQPSEKAPIIIQPNFDVLVPPDFAYDQLWRMEKISNFRRRDVMTEFHLSQKSLLRAMRRGWTAESIYSFLSESAGGRIPDLVQFSIQEWCAKYGRVRFEKVVLVECNDADLAEEISHLPDASNVLQRRVSPTHFAVPVSQAKALFQRLREKGYEPSSKQTTSDIDS